MTNDLMDGGTLAFSEPMTEIAKALVAAQKKMGSVTKDKTASVQMKSGGKYSYTYANLGSVLDAVLPALHEAGISVVQGTGAHYNGSAEVTVTTMLLHESGQWLRSAMAMRPTGADPQSIGSAVTYARRYALLSMCGVAADDDDGAAASKKREDPTAAKGHDALPEPIEREEAEAVLALLDRANKPAAKTILWTTGNRTDDAYALTPHESQTLCKRLYQALDKLKGAACEACAVKADKSGAIEHEYDDKGVPCPNDVSRAAEKARALNAESDRRAVEQEIPF